VYQLFRFVTMKTTRPLHASLCKEKSDIIKRARYIDRSCEGTSKAVFHMVAFVWGWLVLRDLGWLPWCIGGTGALDDVLRKNIQSELPFGSPPRAIVRYGLFTSGYHYSELIRHVFISSRKSDFEEMVVHHIVTMALYLGYFMANMHCVGAFIAVLHDISDIFISIARVFQATAYQRVAIFFFAVMMATWVWARLYILPYTIWFMEAVMVPEFFAKLEYSELYVSYIHAMCFFLGCLALLHYWWFWLISQMLRTIVFKGQLIDMHQTVDGDRKRK
jgi:hypothetical protein